MQEDLQALREEVQPETDDAGQTRDAPGVFALDPGISGEEEADREGPPADGSREEEPPAAEVRVKFNKQERIYTADQAAPLVEMGLKWDSFRPHHEKLRYLAAARGQSVGELVDRLIEESDGQLYQRLLDECEGSEAAAFRLLEVQKSERWRLLEQDGARELEQERREQEQWQERLESRLADEFLQLAAEFPGRFGGFADVPAAVVEEAAAGNVTLLDAYLRFAHQEARRTGQERARQTAAAARSAGTLRGAQHAHQPDLDSFEQAFYTALR